MILTMRRGSIGGLQGRRVPCQTNLLYIISLSFNVELVVLFSGFPGIVGFVRPN